LVEKRVFRLGKTGDKKQGSRAIVKKIRRTRIRTETSRLVFIQEQTTGGGELTGDHKVCPTCGQPGIAPPADSVPAICAEIHTDEAPPTRVRSEKTGETE